jgi:sortase B
MDNMQGKWQNTRRMRRLYITLLVLFILAGVVCVGILVHNRKVRKTADENYDRLADSSLAAEDGNEESDILEKLGISVPEKDLDWEALWKENEDIYAWIYIPDTQVDYPVLQNSTELDYYLNHNLDDSYGYPGCVYSQYLNNKGFQDPNTILYGHNMANGSMFNTLHYFEDEKFFNDNRYIYIYTPDTVYVYEIFAATSFTSDHLIYTYDFWKALDFNTFVSDIRSSRGMTNQLRDDVEVSYGDYMLTLSTCIKGQADKRWLVVGKLLNPMEENVGEGE